MYVTFAENYCITHRVRRALVPSFSIAFGQCTKLWKSLGKAKCMVCVCVCTTYMSVSVGVPCECGRVWKQTMKVYRIIAVALSPG